MPLVLLAVLLAQRIYGLGMAVSVDRRLSVGDAGMIKTVFVVLLSCVSTVSWGLQADKRMSSVLIMPSCFI